MERLLSTSVLCVALNYSACFQVGISADDEPDVLHNVSTPRQYLLE